MCLILRNVRKITKWFVDKGYLSLSYKELEEKQEDDWSYIKKQTSIQIIYFSGQDIRVVRIHIKIRVNIPWMHKDNVKT
jgi:hypothetical protein